MIGSCLEGRTAAERDAAEAQRRDWNEDQSYRVSDPLGVVVAAVYDGSQTSAVAVGGGWDRRAASGAGLGLVHIDAGKVCVQPLLGVRKLAPHHGRSLLSWHLDSRIDRLAGN